MTAYYHLPNIAQGRCVPPKNKHTVLGIPKAHNIGYTKHTDFVVKSNQSKHVSESSGSCNMVANLRNNMIVFASNANYKTALSQVNLNTQMLTHGADYMCQLKGEHREVSTYFAIGQGTL